ncbi:Stp1/IreP family PP2C-type Ser/Thr phosphatase [Paenibacillus chartarius]|uniref:Stp1/IreP family PP2C-type Ser/Thr phosphatase n=1 Tax=Paenibacillus chartarius TaxID=747481 RepID=A0ABV6DTU1_9BACL
MHLVSRTDIGNIRLVNEDRAVVRHVPGGWSVAVVADGMGGQQAGDVASQMAVDIIQRELQRLSPELAADDCAEELRRAIEVANENIYEFALGRENYHGMGTTVVSAVANGQTAIIGHIGDSRAYLISDAGMEQLTEDHSLVNELVKNGHITPEEAAHHPRRNVIIRALGTDPTVEVDLRLVPWKAGNLLLLCSDGLHGLVDDDSILEVVRGEPDLDRMALRLIHSALDAGGDDNVTVVLIKNGAEGGDRG